MQHPVPSLRAAPGRRTGTGRRTVVGAVAVLATATVALAAIRIPIRINYRSPSAPRGVYRLTAEAIERWSWVVVCLPPPIAAAGRRRGYLPAGLPPARCPDGSSEVLKRVAAVAGDAVAVAPAGVTVNGRLLPGTPVLSRDSAGRPLHALASEYRLAPGELFLLSDCIPNSWDSRYYGPVAESSVRATAKPLWVFP